MMVSDVSVHFSGPSSSFLSYEIMNSFGDQEGFLLGQVTTKVTDGISDSQLNYERKETIVNVEGTLPCNEPCSFYDGAGQVNEESLKKIVGDQYTSLVGWYRFRRNSTMEPFARERAIHTNLTNLLPQARRAFFLLGLLTVTTTANVATHSIDQKFLRFDRFKKTIEVVPVLVGSLGSTSHSEYRWIPPSLVDQRHKFDKIYLPLSKKDGICSFGQSAMQVSAVQASFQLALEDLCEKVSVSESRVTSLKEEINNLEAQVRYLPSGGDKKDTIEPWTSTTQCEVGDLLRFDNICESNLTNSPTF